MRPPAFRYLAETAAIGGLLGGLAVAELAVPGLQIFVFPAGWLRWFSYSDILALHGGLLAAVAPIMILAALPRAVAPDHRWAGMVGWILLGIGFILAVTIAAAVLLPVVPPSALRWSLDALDRFYAIAPFLLVAASAALVPAESAMERRARAAVGVLSLGGAILAAWSVLVDHPFDAAVGQTLQSLEQSLAESDAVGREPVFSREAIERMAAGLVLAVGLLAVGCRRKDAVTPYLVLGGFAVAGCVFLILWPALRSVGLDGAVLDSRLGLAGFHALLGGIAVMAGYGVALRWIGRTRPAIHSGWHWAHAGGLALAQVGAVAAVTVSGVYGTPARVPDYPDFIFPAHGAEAACAALALTAHVWGVIRLRRYAKT